jgi:predicted permease
MAVLSGIVPVFLIIGVGALARRWGWAGEAFIRDLNRVIFWFAIPALLLRLLGQAELNAAVSAPMIGACLAATTLTGIIAFVYSVARREDPKRLGVIVQAAVRGNLVYMAFPVIFATAGTEALTLAAVTAAILIPYQNLLAVMALARGGNHSGLGFIKAVLFNPVVLGVAGGLLWNASGWSAWDWLDTFLRLLGNIAMPGALLALGAQMELQGLRRSTHAVAVSTLLKVGVAPAIGLALMTAFGIEPATVLVGTFLLAAPTAIASTAVAQEMGGDLELAGACVMGASLAAFPAFLVWGIVCQ